MTTQEDKQSLPATDILTPEVRLSFPVLFVPKPIVGATDQTPRFGCTLLLPPKSDMKPWIAAIKAAMHKKWQREVKIPSRNMPLKDCATFEYKTTRYAGYEDGWTFIRVSSKLQPSVVNRANVPVSDPSQVYAGMWVRAYLNAFAWMHPQSGNGVSFGLNAIQIVRDDTRLDGRRNATDVFTALEPLAGEDSDDDGPRSLSDMLA